MLSKRKIIQAVLLIVLAVLSATVVTDYAAKPENHKKSLACLDEKKENVLKVTALTTATSTAITLIPGDVATPIAEKFADLSGYLLVILAAIFLEKYLLTITAYAFFTVAIPVACILGIMYIWTENRGLKNLAFKIFGVGLALFIAIPSSVWISNMVEHTYETSLMKSLENEEDISEEIAEEKEETDTSAAEKTDETGSFWDRAKEWITGAKENINDVVSDAASAASGKSRELLQEAEKTMNNMIEAVAIMIITSCVIPIAVILFWIWLIKMIFGVDIDLNRISHKFAKIPKKEEEN